MKAKIILPIFLLLLVSLISCKKESSNDPPAINSLSVNGCKPIEDNTKSVGPPFPQEYITLNTIDDSYLLFNHINSILNCQPGQITVALSISNDTITLNEEESEYSADCVCPFDITFKLGPLEEGIYTIMFQKFGGTFKEYSLDFNKSTDIRIDL